MKKFFDIIPPKKLKRRRIALDYFIDKGLIKIICLLLIVGLNWIGILAIYNTLAYFQDIEESNDNICVADILDFHLYSPADFFPEVTPSQPTIRNISVINNGSLSFQYQVYASDFSGDSELCDVLELVANLDGGDPEYTGGLTGFSYNTGEFFDPEDWQFIAFLPDDISDTLEDKTCSFKFIFEGVQLGDCLGFSDQEMIFNTIYSGELVIPPPTGLKINEVYYDVLENKHCTEAKNEWIELYNPTATPISLQKWELCHGYNEDAVCNHINANVDIPSLGFVAVGHDNSTWVHCFPDVPSITIHQLGGPWPELGNEGDYIILKDPSGEVVDCVSWGNDPDTCGFPDNPVPGVSAEGHSIARKIAGVDTDTAADWEDLPTPNPGTNPYKELFSEILDRIVGEGPVITLPGINVIETNTPGQDGVETNGQEQGQEQEPIDFELDTVIDIPDVDIIKTVTSAEDGVEAEDDEDENE